MGSLLLLLLVPSCTQHKGTAFAQLCLSIDPAALCAIPPVAVAAAACLCVTATLEPEEVMMFRVQQDGSGGGALAAPERARIGTLLLLLRCWCCLRLTVHGCKTQDRAHSSLPPRLPSTSSTQAGTLGLSSCWQLSGSPGPANTPCKQLNAMELHRKLLGHHLQSRHRRPCSPFFSFLPSSPSSLPNPASLGFSAPARI